MQLNEMDIIAMVVGLVVAMFVLRMILRGHFVDRRTREAQRPWRRYSAALSLGYVATLIAITYAVNSGRMDHPGLVLLAVVVTALLGIAVIWVSVRELRAADEFVQKVEIESLALAFALTIVGIVARAQLMIAGLVSDLGVLGVLHVTIYAFLFARIVVYLRYR